MAAIHGESVRVQVMAERARRNIVYTDEITPDFVSYGRGDMFYEILWRKRLVQETVDAVAEFVVWARANELPHFEDTGCWLLQFGPIYGDNPKNWYYILLDGGTGELYYYYYHREKPFEKYILTDKNAGWFIQKVIMPAIITYCVRHNLTWQEPVEETPSDS